MSPGFFIVPALLGWRQDLMLANLVDFYTREVLDWNFVSVGVILYAIGRFPVGLDQALMGVAAMAAIAESAGRKGEWISVNL